MSISSNERKYRSLINRFWLFWFWRRLFYFINIVATKNKVLEVGCGEGFVLGKINRIYPEVKLFGLDISTQAIGKIKKKYSFINAQVGDVYQLPFSDNEFPLILALEILEHLNQPQEALKEIKRVAGDYVILSVPWEPWFSIGSFMRGKYLRTCGRHPEHVNFWSKGEFTKLISKHFQVVEVTHSFPWLIAVLKKK